MQRTPVALVMLGLLVGLALAIARLIMGSSSDTQPAPTVAARPPLEAVPVATPAQASRERMRQCEQDTAERKLDGKARQMFLQNCIALHPGEASPP